MTTEKSIYEEYAKKRADKESIEELIKSTKAPFIERIKAIEDEMAAALQNATDSLKTNDNLVKALTESIMATWPEGIATIDLPNGAKLVRSTLRSVEVKNNRELLGTLLNLIQEDDKLPFTVKWTDKGILPLVDANVIPSEVASVSTSYRLSLRRAKD